MPRSRIVDFLKNISYTFTSNVLSLLISTIIILVIPKFIGVEQYGYYQLYIFYTGYVGVLAFGWYEGIYLREGGKYYKDLEKPLYSTQFRLLGLCEVIIYLLIFIGSLFIVDDENKHFVIGCTCVVAVAMCLRWFITFILQATGRIKEFAIVTISEKIILVILAILLILTGYRQSYLLICANVLAVFVSLGIGIWYCKDLVFSSCISIKNIFGEIKENISAGFQLLLVELSSLLINRAPLGYINIWKSIIDFKYFQYGGNSYKCNISGNVSNTSQNKPGEITANIQFNANNTYGTDIRCTYNVLSDDENTISVASTVC